MLVKQRRPGRRLQSLCEREVQVLDRLVDLRRTLIPDGNAVNAGVSECVLHCSLPVLAGGNAPSPTNFMLITPMPSVRTCFTCVTTSLTFPAPLVL